MSEIIIIRPIIEGDEVTPICYEEAQEVINYAENRGWKVTDIGKGEATRIKVEETLKEKPHAIVCHYNHGNETSWLGSDKQPCIKLENVKLLANRECYAQNCSSAKKLGVEAWKGKATYWGYRDIYIFTVDEKEYFKEFNNYGIKLRIDGEKWGEILPKVKALANKLVDELVKKGKALAAACLRHNADVLVLYDEEHPPTSNCALRRACIKIFGPKVGWKISKHFPISVATFFFGLGVLIHDYCHALWQLGGYKELISPQGGYIGAAIAIMGFTLAYCQIWSLLKSEG